MSSLMNVKLSSLVVTESAPSASAAEDAATSLSRIASTAATISGSWGLTATGWERQAAAIMSTNRTDECFKQLRSDMRILLLADDRDERDMHPASPVPAL